MGVCMSGVNVSWALGPAPLRAPGPGPPLLGGPRRLRRRAQRRRARRSAGPSRTCLDYQAALIVSASLEALAGLWMFRLARRVHSTHEVRPAPPPLPLDASAGPTGRRRLGAVRDRVRGVVVLPDPARRAAPDRARASGRPQKALRFAAICTAGSVLGGIAGLRDRRPADGARHRCFLDFAERRRRSRRSTRQFEREHVPLRRDRGLHADPVQGLHDRGRHLRRELPGVRGRRASARAARASSSRRSSSGSSARRRKGFLETRFEWVTIGGGIVLVGGFLAVKYVF